MTAPQAVPATPGRLGRTVWALVSGSATPQRLRRLGALLVVGCLLTAALSVIVGSARADQVGARGERLAVLDFDAGELYRSLNEADALATSGFGAQATASPTLLAEYDSDLAGASLRLVHAAELLGADDTDTADEADAALAQQIAYQLPRYVTTVEAARALRAQGSPRARSELQSATELMRTIILPVADTLQQNRRAALTANYQRASDLPAVPVLLAAGTLIAIGVALLRERRRTNRVLNVGLAASALLMTAVLVWWLAATLTATGQLSTARESDDRATLLSQARVAVLQARADETVAVASGVPADEVAGTLSDRFDRLVRPGGVLDAGGPPSSADGIRTALGRWQGAVRDGAGSDGSRVAFVRLTTTLADGIGDEQGRRSTAVDRAASALTGLPVGPAALAVLAAVAAVAGIGVRLREFPR